MSLMLSAETAAGQYPFEAVNIMDRIIARVEQDPGWRAITEAGRPEPERSSADAIAAAAGQVSHTIGAEAIVAYTSSGGTALRIAQAQARRAGDRAHANLDTARRMAVVWEVHAVVSADVHSMTDAVSKAVRVAQAEGFGSHGQEIVVAAGVPFGQSGTTNALRVAVVR